MACKKDIAIDTPLPSSPYKIVPDTGYVGLSVRIYGKDFYPDGHNLIRFSNTFNFWSDSVNSSYLVATVPFEAKSGPITVLTNSGEIEIPASGSLNHTTILLSLSNGGIYSPSSLLESDSCMFDLTGIRRCWERTISSDTVSIVLPDFHNYNAEIRTHVFRFKNNGPNTLPSLFSFYFVRNNGSSVQVDTVNRGIIKIHSWNPTGLIQGRIFIPLYFVPPYLLDFFRVN